MAKVALLIGVSDYEPGLEPLPSAIRDIEAMQQVLANPEMGDFAIADITVLPNPDRQTMETAIYRLFANRQKDDLVLLYFSGHGVLDDSHEFYFSSRSTQKEQGRLVPTTAVVARSVQSWMEQSRSQRQVIILDSCFSGAFARGVTAKDSGSVNLEQFLGGKGRAILTASTSTQYALTQEGLDLSVYTHYLVEGIRTGGADLDNDGFIAVEELHTYASSKVREAAPAMTPEFYPVKEGFKIILAKSPKDDPQLKYRKEVERRANQGKFTVPARRLLNSLRYQLNLSLKVATAIESEVLQPYREHQRKLQEYEQTLIETLEAENPLSQRTLNDLKDYQQHLALLDEDVAPIAAKLLGQSLQTPANTSATIVQPDPGTYFEFEVVTVDAEGKENSRSPGHASFFSEDLGNGVTLEMVEILPSELMLAMTIDGSLMGTADVDRNTIIQEITRHGVKQEDAEKWVGWEMPQHPVKVPEFWMGKFAVTQAQWSQVAGLPKAKIDLNADPAKFKGVKHPVEQVSWEEAVEFCDRLSRKTGKPYRLPSEAEWEYACRAGTTTPFYFGETVTSDLVNCNGNYPYGNAPEGEYRSQTAEVGIFPPNGFGLYDMHGNVWEWCADPWHENYRNAPTDGSVWISNGGSDRIIRGGSWNYAPVGCRAAYRLHPSPADRRSRVGFRVVCSVFPGLL
jgi:formylglycine-generating enzyme required for sulfatase activity